MSEPLSFGQPAGAGDRGAPSHGGCAAIGLRGRARGQGVRATPDIQCASGPRDVRCIPASVAPNRQWCLHATARGINPVPPASGLRRFTARYLGRRFGVGPLYSKSAEYSPHSDCNRYGAFACLPVRLHSSRLRSDVRNELQKGNACLGAHSLESFAEYGT